MALPVSGRQGSPATALFGDFSNGWITVDLLSLALTLWPIRKLTVAHGHSPRWVVEAPVHALVLLPDGALMET